MPELPEVQTTVDGLQSSLPGLYIKDVWTDYGSDFHKGKENIKNPDYLKKFKKQVTGQKIKNVTRRGKNILIHLDNGKTILVHMKMTGHLLVGKYLYKINKNQKNSDGATRWRHWTPVEPEALKDPFNGWIRLMLTLSKSKSTKASTGDKYLALSDMRKFAKVVLLDTDRLEESKDLSPLGPEPLEDSFTLNKFKERLLKKPGGKIKQVLMDQSIIAGIGNIYADEILWKIGIHPKERVENISSEKLKEMYKSMKKLLQKGVRLGGDSMSDYRNTKGELGNFQKEHNAYQKDGEVCTKKDCRGIIEKTKVGGRTSHFCPKHQKIKHER